MVKVNPTDKLVFDLEMFQIDFNEQKKESLRQEISEKYGVPLKNVEVNFVPITVNEEGDKVSLASDIINNIQDPKFQQLLMKDYINLRGYEDVDFEEILNIDKKVNAFINFDCYSKFKPYKIKYLKWDNYLSYGKGNFIDFTKLKGLILLTGQPENQSGKTTLAISLLRFALFGKSDKTPTLDKVFNKFLEKETEVMVEAGLEIDGVDYVIRRTITRPVLVKRTSKSTPKQKIEYFKKKVNGELEEIENCEAESGTQTNNIIRETVGSDKDFDLVISATNRTLGDLLRMGQTDKSKLFSRWLGLLSIEEKEKIAKDLWKEESKKLLSNKYNKSLLENEINDMKTVIEYDNKAIIESEANVNKANENIDKFNNEKISIIKERKEIKEELIKTDVTTIENRMKYLSDELTNKRALQNTKKERYMQIKDAKFDVDIYNQKKNEEKEKIERQAELRTKINALKEDNRRIEELMRNEKCPNCGQKIDTDKQTEFIDINKKKIQEHIEEGLKTKSELEEMTKLFARFEQDRKDENELNRLKPEMSAIKAQIDNIKMQLADLERQKKEIEVNKENIIHNNEIDNKLRIVDINIKTETEIKEKHIREITKCKTEVTNYTNEISKREKIISELIKEEKVIRDWNIYQELVGKKGIIKIALRKALPIVNNEVSRLIDGLCDFKVVLSLDDNNNVCIDLIKDGVSMDLAVAASGWEGTISSIALRSALSNICSFSKPNMITLDEILAGVGAENTENVFKLFRRILPNYDNIIHICHDITLVDQHDQLIVVTKKDNVSQIEIR